MDDELIQLRVADVKVAVPAGNGVEAGLVVLEEEVYPYRTLRMFIGQPEARAIHVPWSNTIPPRPSTWDLFVSTIAILDGRIERVVITDVEELRHYFAQIAIVQNEDEEPILITARPSDALALALRSYGAKIYAHPHVLDEAGVLADGTRWVPPEPSPVPEPSPSPSPEPSPSPFPEPEAVPSTGSEPSPPPDREPEADAVPAGDAVPAAEPEPVVWPSGVEEIGPATSEPVATPPTVHEAQETPIPVAESDRAVVEPAPVEPVATAPQAATAPDSAPAPQVSGGEPVPAPSPEPTSPPPSPDLAFPAAAPAEPAVEKRNEKGKDKKAKSDADRKKAKKKKKLAKKKSGPKDAD